MSDKPAPPYPASTRAKGWRFELDYERIEQSDTWALAAEVPMAQAALLMMWLVAWRQEPCGSLPADEDVIRSKLRIPASQWPKLRAVLMRGWWEASDGRLYHRTLSMRVEEMLTKRRGDADRQAARRMKQERESREHPKESRVTPAGVQSESSTDHRPLITEESANALSARGAVGLALKAAGLDPMSFNLTDPRVDALIAAGATPEQWQGLAAEALKGGKQAPWAWVLAVMPERLKAGKAIKPAGRHAGFAAKDYRAGVTDDGYIAAT